MANIISATNPDAVLAITTDFLDRLAGVDRRLPPELARELAIVRQDVVDARHPEAIPVLDIPPATPLVLSDGRRLTHLRDIDGAALAGRPVLLRFWQEVKHGLAVAVSSDQTPHGTLLHATLSYPGHYPSWRDIKVVKASLFGDIDAMMVLPRAEDYVAVHPNCFHLWQLPVSWGIQ
jgi:hypothetical protein